MKTLLVLAAGLAGFFCARLLRLRRRTLAPNAAPKKVGGWDRQYTGAFPRYSGAMSAVTGGPPEDMNEMPAAPTPEHPIYDGSQLEQPR